MTATWKENSTATPESAYSDWEMQTRPDHLKDVFVLPGGPSPDGGGLHVPVPAWRPCHVRLNGETDAKLKANAKAVLKEAAKPLSKHPIRLPDLSVRQLQRLVASASPVSDVLRYVVVYTLEPLYGPPVTYTWFDIMRYGIAVPGLTLLDDLQDTGATPSTSPTATAAPAPDGPPPVVTAIIDIGFGIANDRFCVTENGQLRTRVRQFWQQSRETVTDKGGFGIGRIYDAETINHLLDHAAGDERRFYNALRSGAYGEVCFRSDTAGGPPQVSRAAQGITNPPNDDRRSMLEEMGATGSLPSTSAVSMMLSAAADTRPLGFRTGHGTWVADLAAGWPAHADRADRPIVAVELPGYAVAETAGQRLEMFILMGVQQILDWVDDWEGSGQRAPVVINVSLGNTAGPRDGTGFLERELARLVSARDGEVPTKLVLAAGNAYRDRLSAQMELQENQSGVMDWVLPPGDKSPSFLEIRPSGPGVALEVETPGGERVLVHPGTTYDLVLDDGALIGRVYNETENGGRLVTVALAATAPPDRPAQRAPNGTYRVHATNHAAVPQTVRLAVQRDESIDNFPELGRQSVLDHPGAYGYDPETGDYERPVAGAPIRRERTLSAHATSNSEAVFVVGGTVATDRNEPFGPRATRYSSAGPSFGTRLAPDLAAVTEAGMATDGVLTSGFFAGSAAIFSGTSGAAPQLTRQIVDLLDQAAGPLSKAEILAALALRRTGTANDPRLGQGELAQVILPGKPVRRPSMGV